MRTSAFCTFGALIALLFIPFGVTSAIAHSIHVFAYVDGDRIKGEGAYDDGSIASGAEIQIHDANGKLIGQTKISPEGDFVLPFPQGLPPFEVSINDGTGHVNAFIISQDELHRPETSGVERGEPYASAGQATEHGVLSKVEMVRILRDELAPVKAQLARLSSRKKISLQEIVGGLGWIMGIFGFIMWFLSRKERTSFRHRQ